VKFEPLALEKILSYSSLEVHSFFSEKKGSYT